MLVADIGPWRGCHGGVEIGSWLHRRLTTWPVLAPGQQQLMTALGLTPGSNR
ncbi:hypothetical protein ACGFZQ_49175 [Streptomyces sp. NPDC048254]|uniref:hypothetical protein n=1 Tax=Streptomyces sp. NPDC048254 TaxID=3365525 RepID=UPI0037125D39